MKSRKRNPGILYVDDEEKSQKYFRRYFINDFPVYTASNVSDAKNILEKQSADIGILLTDQRMPQESGTELLKYVHGRYPRIVRLLTTAYSDLDDAIEAVNNGEIYRYITKPWDIRLLGIEIRHAARYFIINTEREQLLNEKLSSQQKLLSANIARDLIILSSGFTHIHNPEKAIYHYLKQPLINCSYILNGLPNVDLFVLIKKEISRVLDIARKLIAETLPDNSDRFELISIPLLIKDSFNRYDQLYKPEVNIDNEIPSIYASRVLIEKLILNIINLLNECDSRNRQGSIFINGVNNGVQVQFTSKCIDFPAISLPNIAVQLLIAYFITYHHNGMININNNNNNESSIEIILPMNPTDIVLPELNQNWIDEIMEHHEYWYS